MGQRFYTGLLNSIKFWINIYDTIDLSNNPNLKSIMLEEVTHLKNLEILKSIRSYSMK